MDGGHSKTISIFQISYSSLLGVIEAESMGNPISPLCPHFHSSLISTALFYIYFLWMKPVSIEEVLYS